MGEVYVTAGDIRAFGIEEQIATDLSKGLQRRKDETHRKLLNIEAACSNFLKVVQADNYAQYASGRRKGLIFSVKFADSDKAAVSAYGKKTAAGERIIDANNYRNIMIYGANLVFQIRTFLTGELINFDYGAELNASTPDRQLMRKTFTQDELFSKQNQSNLHASLSKQAVMIEHSLTQMGPDPNQADQAGKTWKAFGQNADEQKVYNDLWKYLIQMYSLDLKEQIENSLKLSNDERYLQEESQTSAYVSGRKQRTKKFQEAIDNKTDKKFKGQKFVSSVILTVNRAQMIQDLFGKDLQMPDPENPLNMISFVEFIKKTKNTNFNNITMNFGWLFEWFEDFINHPGYTTDMIKDLLDNRIKTLQANFLLNYSPDQNPGVQGGDSFYFEDGKYDLEHFHTTQSKFGNNKIISFNSIVVTIANIKTILEEYLRPQKEQEENTKIQETAKKLSLLFESDDVIMGANDYYDKVVDRMIQILAKS